MNTPAELIWTELRKAVEEGDGYRVIELARVLQALNEAGFQIVD